MKRDLPSIAARIRNGKGPSFLLLYGDDFRVQTACKTVIDLLVPPDRRELNLERFDGRSAPWDQIAASLMTPPFLPGTKAVVVENAPYFYSREHKHDLGERVLQLWRDGRKDDAAKLVLNLAALEGWSQEKWQNLQTSSDELVELLGGESREAEEDGSELLAYCRSQGLGLGPDGARGHRLFELIDAGLPDWAFLLLTAVQVDRRTRLYKRFEEAGALLDLSVERDRSGRVNRESVAEFVQHRLREAKKNIEPRAREMILLRAGEEFWGIHQELEKLLLYIGDRPAVRAGDVEEVFSDHGEGWIFDLTRTIAERNALTALAHLTRLMTQGEHPLKLLGTIAGELRRLLSARQLIDGEKRGRWRTEMTYSQFQKSVLEHGPPILTRHPFADYMCFQRAEKFSLAELVADLQLIHDTDLRLKSSGHQPRMVMERLVVGMCLGARDSHARREQ